MIPEGYGFAQHHHYRSAILFEFFDPADINQLHLVVIDQHFI